MRWGPIQSLLLFFSSSLDFSSFFPSTLLSISNFSDDFAFGFFVLTLLVYRSTVFLTSNLREGKLGFRVGDCLSSWLVG
ncbi:unnamed protein product [Citrullus colocynthis]|uniref:Secreted protein n=1 Tax=Citrullus colocynthis TaxID=252529 RepID=A0ABP0Z5M3_9ROSI